MMMLSRRGQDCDTPEHRHVSAAAGKFPVLLRFGVNVVLRRKILLNFIQHILYTSDFHKKKNRGIKQIQTSEYLTFVQYDTDKLINKTVIKWVYGIDQDHFL